MVYLESIELYQEDAWRYFSFQLHSLGRYAKSMSWISKSDKPQGSNNWKCWSSINVIFPLTIGINTLFHFFLKRKLDIVLPAFNLSFLFFHEVLLHNFKHFKDLPSKKKKNHNKVQTVLSENLFCKTSMERKV